MRIKTVKAVEGGWNVFPQSGLFEGKLVGKADGISLRAVDFKGNEIHGEVCAIWGMEVLDQMIFNDPATVRGLRVGASFDMRDQNAIEENSGGFVLSDSGLKVIGASLAWVMGDEMQVYGETLRVARSQREGVAA